MNPINRRDFIGLTVAGSAALLTQNTNVIATPPPKYRIRRNIANLPPDSPQITALKRVVRLMRALPSNNRRSWEAQVEIHRKYCHQGFVHGTWFFLPWHRAFLYYFEKICIQILKDDGFSDINPEDFALPYWDWSDLSKKVPSVFFEDGSPLNYPGRKAELEEITLGNIITDAYWAAKIENLPNNPFALFHGSPKIPNRESSGTLEKNHNLIHSLIGGVMKDVKIAANDPIFWLHHANVDRIWTKWARANLGVFSKEFSNDTNWNLISDGFNDGAGNSYDIKTVLQLLSTHALGYHYDCPEDKNPIEPKLTKLTLFASENYFVKSEFITTGTAQLNETFAANLMEVPTKLDKSVKNIIDSQPTNIKSQTTLRLTIEVEKPKNPEISVMIFMFNKSDFNDEGKLNNPSELSVFNPAYVGSIYFFESTEDHGEMTSGMMNINDDTRSFFLDATETVLKLDRFNKFISLTDIKVLIYPVLLEGATASIMDEIELKSFKFEYIK